MTQIISQLRSFKERNCFPCVELDCAVIAADKVKLKIYKTRTGGSEKRVLEDIGILGLTISNILKGKPQVQYLTKIGKARFDGLMQDFVAGEGGSL